MLITMILYNNTFPHFLKEPTADFQDNEFLHHLNFKYSRTKNKIDTDPFYDIMAVD